MQPNPITFNKLEKYACELVPDKFWNIFQSAMRRSFDRVAMEYGYDPVFFPRPVPSLQDTLPDLTPEENAQIDAEFPPTPPSPLLEGQNEPAEWEKDIATKNEGDNTDGDGDASTPAKSFNFDW
jgi:hypothetical protein